VSGSYISRNRLYQTQMKMSGPVRLLSGSLSSVRWDQMDAVAVTDIGDTFFGADEIDLTDWVQHQNTVIGVQCYQSFSTRRGRASRF
jgi:hypothetical protein